MRAESQILNGPRKPRARSQRQQPANDLQRLSALAVQIDLAGLGLDDHLAPRGGAAQSVPVGLGHAADFSGGPRLWQPPQRGVRRGRGSRVRRCRGSRVRRGRGSRVRRCRGSRVRRQRANVEGSAGRSSSPLLWIEFRPSMALHDLFRSPGRAGVLAASVGLTLLAGGCGAIKRGENPNIVAGKVAFVGRCGSCHTLARAATKGEIGPNLDAAFRESLSDGLQRSAIRSVVQGQILNPNPTGAMPAGLATGKLVNDISAYVADVADRPGQDTGLLAQAVHPAGAGAPAVEKAGTLQIDADPTGQLSYVTKQASATAGAVTVSMKNMSAVTHNIAIQQGTGPTGPVLAASKFVVNNGVASFKITLKPGTYTYFCQVPGHRAAGMVGTLTVK